MCVCVCVCVCNICYAVDFPGRFFHSFLLILFELLNINEIKELILMDYTLNTGDGSQRYEVAI